MGFHRRLRRQAGSALQFRFELLEDRVLLAADFRTIDGTDNHPLDLGAAETPLLRVAGPAYPDDGSGTTIIQPPARENPRVISNAVNDQDGINLVNDRQMSDFVWAWGQFLDHDISETPADASHGVANIQVPTGDPDFDPFGTGAAVIPFTRSEFDSSTGAREQINAITAFVDASNVYGSDEATANSLRTFVDGKLATTADGQLLPVVDGMFAAGDVRANEQAGLTSMHTLFVREHNRLADLLAADPEIDNRAAAAGLDTDEYIYQLTRKIVGAEMQIITYNEFLPALLGDFAPLATDYAYSDSVDPSIATEFSTALFRVGHTMLSSDLLLVNDADQAEKLPLRDAFFDPSILGGEDLTDPVDTGNMDRLLRGFATQLAQEVDAKVIDDVRNFLFGAPGSGGLDLPSLNIQRGRDHGLPDYNSVRVAYGLAPKTAFLETGGGNGITSDPELASALQSVYGTLDNIDPWVGGLAEDHWAGSTGELIATGIHDQFARLRDGDRFFYVGDSYLDDPLVSQIIDLDNLTLGKVIEYNTTITSLQANVFFAPAYGQGESVYLSDLTPVGTPINGWGPIEIDMSVGGQGSGDGGVLLLNGVAYEKGLGVHADSEVVYSLNGEFDRFRSDIGLNGGPRDNGEVVFEVYGDGALLYSSGVMTGESLTQALDIDVRGVDELRLVVDSNGSIDHDSANWADARLTRPLPNFEYLSDMTPVGTPINGWGPIELDMSTGGQGSGDGGVLLLNGVAYEKGLGVHADSEVVYNLNGEYHKFFADIGLNGGPRDNGEVAFEVYGDGVLLFDSGVMTGNSVPQSVDLDVTGVFELRLVVDALGSIDHDSANWADARLTRPLTNVEYLSDLTPASTPINGWGPIEIDMSVGGQGSGDGGVLLLNGVPYEKGLGVHADSEVVYSLNGEFDRFRSDIGLNGGPRDNGEVIFEVYGDGALLYSSGVMTGESLTQALDIDVRGVNELRLVVDGNGSIDHDSANWADAKLLPSNSERFLLGDFNADNTVTGLDFLALQRGSGSNNAGRTDGDADFDGDVDAADLSWWEKAYTDSNTADPPSAVIVATSAVDESSHSIEEQRPALTEVESSNQQAEEPAALELVDQEPIDTQIGLGLRNIILELPDFAKPHAADFSNSLSDAKDLASATVRGSRGSSDASTNSSASSQRDSANTLESWAYAVNEVFDSYGERSELRLEFSRALEDLARSSFRNTESSNMSRRR